MRIALVLVAVGVAAFLVWWLAGDDNLRAVERADREAEQIEPGAGKRGASQASEAGADGRETETKEPEARRPSFGNRRHSAIAVILAIAVIRQSE